MMNTSDTVKREFRLNCYIGSVRMCAMIAKVASRYSSTVTISRGRGVCGTKSIMELLINLDEPLGQDGLPSELVCISAFGPDAQEALLEMLSLFPAEPGPTRCAIPGCTSAAVLLGPNGADEFAYRCREHSSYQDHDRHEWAVKGKSLRDDTLVRQDILGRHHRTAC
jgi:phosphotransferase system HPr-like phosphotransfer protein